VIYRPFNFAQVLLILVMILVSTKVLAEDFASSQQWKIVNYWSLWCGPCRVEIPELNLLSKELIEFDVVLVGVNYDEDPREKTLKIAKRMGISFPTLEIDTVGRLQLEAPHVLPTTYILDPNNKVVAKLTGAQDRESLKKVLTEQGAI
jgi:thiol-disulfide isomerase/thioredoxin